MVVIEYDGIKKARWILPGSGRHVDGNRIESVCGTLTDQESYTAIYFRSLPEAREAGYDRRRGTEINRGEVDRQHATVRKNMEQLPYRSLARI